MTNSEGIFMHLSPEDRPAVVAQGRSFESDEERALLTTARTALALLPSEVGRGEKTHYTDFDRASYVIDQAKAHGLEVSREDAMQYLVLADIDSDRRRREAVDLRARTENWREGIHEPEGLSGQDRRDIIRMNLTEEMTPQDILPNQPDQEASND